MKLGSKMKTEHDIALEKLLGHVGEDLIVNKKAYLMTDLLQMYQSFLP
jgi:hypothetical protein